MSDEQQARRAKIEEDAAASQSATKRALAKFGKATSGWLSEGERQSIFRRRKK